MEEIFLFNRRCFENILYTFLYFGRKFTSIIVSYRTTLRFYFGRHIIIRRILQGVGIQSTIHNLPNEFC